MSKQEGKHTTVVACKTLEDELELAMKKAGIDFPVIWVESGLHNTPKKLAARLQEILCGIDTNIQRVLLVMGFCGNAIQDLVTINAELVIPRVDDCISLLLGSTQTRIKISEELAAYFLTEGWLRGERNLWEEYQYAQAKYGEEEAQYLAKTMLGNYRTLCLLDSSATPIDALVDKTTIIAETLNLEQKVVLATTSYIEQLLTGPWPDERFIVKAPGEPITLNDLYC